MRREPTVASVNNAAIYRSARALTATNTLASTLLSGAASKLSRLARALGEVTDKSTSSLLGNSLARYARRMAQLDSNNRTISFKCPHCGHTTDVESRFAGQSGPCVSCSKTITIPTLESLAPKPIPKKNSQSMHWAVKTALAVGSITALGLICFLGINLARPVMKAAREAAITADCEANMVLIGQAIEEYYLVNGHYPQAVVRDENGKPMHSWRVSILPYLGPEAQATYAKYDMTKPWDAVENRDCLGEMPPEFRCPADTTLVADETSYLAVVGDRTIINKSGKTVRSGSGSLVLTDQPSETMVLVEAVNCGVVWLEPRDIPVATLRAGLNSRNPVGPASKHSQGVNALMADGAVICLPEETTAEELQGMATIDGDEYMPVLDDILFD